MNTNNDRNLIIVKLVKLVELLKVELSLRTVEQLDEIKLLEKEIDDLKVKIGKQPTKNMFTGTEPDADLVVEPKAEPVEVVRPRFKPRQYNSF